MLTKFSGMGTFTYPRCSAINNAVNTNLKEGTDGLTEIAVVAFENLCCLTLFQKLFFVVFNVRYDA